MTRLRTPKHIVATQTIVLVIAVFLSITSIVDLATGHTGLTLWIGAVCWPLTAIFSVVHIFQARKQV